METLALKNLSLRITVALFLCLNAGLGFASSGPIVNLKADLNQKEEVVLQWTSLELNSPLTYSIERSDVSLGFQLIETGTLLPQHHELIDKNPFDGMNYYRIQVIDQDGEVLSTNLVSVKVEFKSICYTVYPNPIQRSQGDISVCMKGISEAALYRIKVMNMNGVIIYDHTHVFEPNTPGQLSLPFHKPGKYLLLATNDLGKVHKESILVY